MAQVTLQGPDGDSAPFNTGDVSVEKGWGPKRILAALNTMLTELYAGLTGSAAAVAAGAATKYLDVTITSAQLLALNGTPQTVLAAPGAGFANVLLDVIAYKAAGTAYAGIAAGEDLSFKYTNGSGLEVAEIETTGFLDQATAQFRYASTFKAASGISSIVPVENAAIVAQLLVGEITTGTSDLKLRLIYRTIPTTL